MKVGFGTITMKTFLLIPAAALSLGFTLPFGQQHQLSRAGLERAIGHQMNSSPAGRITRAVHCTRLASATTRYRCTLTGMTGTREHLIAVVDGDSWRAGWAPLDG